MHSLGLKMTRRVGAFHAAVEAVKIARARPGVAHHGGMITLLERLKPNVALGRPQQMDVYASGFGCPNQKSGLAIGQHRSTELPFFRVHAASRLKPSKRVLVLRAMAQLAAAQLPVHIERFANQPVDSVGPMKSSTSTCLFSSTL